MKKLNKIYSVLIILGLIVVTIGTMPLTVSANNTNRTAECQSIRFIIGGQNVRGTEFEQERDNQGNPQPVDVDYEIVVNHGDDQPSFSRFQYRLRIGKGENMSNAFSEPFTFEVANAQNNTWQGSGSFTINANNAVGDWRYSLQIDSLNGPVAFGRSSGCNVDPNRTSPLFTITESEVVNPGIGGVCDPLLRNNICTAGQCSGINDDGEPICVELPCNSYPSGQAKLDCLRQRYNDGSTGNFSYTNFLQEVTECQNDAGESESAIVTEVSESSFGQNSTSCALSSGARSCSTGGYSDITQSSYEVCFGYTLSDTSECEVPTCNLEILQSTDQLSVRLNTQCLQAFPGEYEIRGSIVKDIFNPSVGSTSLRRITKNIADGDENYVMTYGQIDVDDDDAAVLFEVHSDDESGRPICSTSLALSALNSGQIRRPSVIDPTVTEGYAYSTEQFGAIRCPYSAYSRFSADTLQNNIGRTLDQIYLPEDEARQLRADGQDVYVIFDVRYPISSVAERENQQREFVQCVDCIDDGGTWTGLGCIITTIEGIFNSMLRIILGVMGGVALIRLMILGYQYQSADDDKIKPAVEDIMATLGGLLLVLFSVVFLRFIGTNLLDIVPPGFF